MAHSRLDDDLALNSQAKRDEAEGGGFALWSARFANGLAPEAEVLNQSLPVDRRLWREELELVTAWSEVLTAARIVTPEQSETIAQGMQRVGERLAEGVAESADDEDIHTLVERLLTEEIGDLAGVLRTGRSRNDQSATGTRLWVMRAATVLSAGVKRVQRALIGQAEATLDVLAPAYTHLQRAQPIRMAHFFLSHFWPLERDRERYHRVVASASVLPLGAGAVAGSGLPLDREALRARLGFRKLSANSIDAVSDRDYIAEFAFAAALLGAHLSRLAEDLILFSSAEFGFVRFDDAYSTGSSLRPQKRNPDIAELARGQSARLIGEVTTVLALLKSLPTGYNKDLQEDKTVLFNVYDTLHKLLPAFAGAVETLRVDPEAAARSLEPSMLSVDIADQLVRAGVTFRDAHAAVGELVRLTEERCVSILDLDPEDARSVHPHLPEALATVGEGSGLQPYEVSVEMRDVIGGTALAPVQAQIQEARAAISE